MDELGEQISDVVIHFNIKTFIGLGVGIGANILVRFALAHPEKVIHRLKSLTLISFGIIFI